MYVKTLNITFALNTLILRSFVKIFYLKFIRRIKFDTVISIHIERRKITKKFPCDGYIFSSR